jgi:hypothetical protein
MATIRTVPRTQSAEYAAGSTRKGFFEYTVHGYEETGSSRQTFELRGRGESRDEAIKAAWAAARAWVGQLGPLVRTDKHLRSEAA